MKNYSLKKENGITLIALIITIIILVILAAVSIRAAYNSGIIDYSINGTKRYTEEEKKEESILSETEDFMASILSKLDELEEDDSDDEDDDTVPDLLRLYILGANYEGRNIDEIMSDFEEPTFINEAESIEDASTSVIFLNSLWEEIVREGLKDYYIKFNDVAYRILIEFDNDENAFMTRELTKVYKPRSNGTEGQIVQYSADGESDTEWLILYDNGNTVDIIPIEIDEEWEYTFGNGDLNAIGDTPLAHMRDSYNNAVERLNAYCETIITNPTAQNVRSIGTAFGIEDTILRR